MNLVYSSAQETQLIKPMYIAAERFGPWSGARWDSYIEWSGLGQLTEIVSLDGLLCPNIINEIRDADWKHNVQEDFLIGFFWDLDYLLERVQGVAQVQILACFRDSDSDSLAAYDDRRFVFKGFDLVDKSAGISALTNCGGFPGVFENDELSRVGLIDSLDRAIEIRESLRVNFPNEYHADCSVWALWRMEHEGG